MANNNVPCEVHDRVYGWCKSSLGGAWATVTKDEFLISPLRGGLTNYMYLCSLPNHKVTKRGETRQLLVRIYGHVAKSMEFILSNSVLFSILAERKLGPKLFGVFPEGRIEEYLPARPLKTKQLSNPEISEQVATKLAQFHSLRVPLNKNPTWFFTHVERWIEESLVLIKSCKKLTLDEKLNKYMSFDLVAEYGELKKLLLSVNSPILFCHNDLQEGNILYDDNCPDPERRMTFIDLDYCNYNFRGFDFGNHMMEWCYDYTYDQPPFFTYTPSSYPTWEQKCRFFRAYMKSQDESRDVTELELSQLSWETDMFALGSSFFWGVWSIVQAAKSEITFDYVEFAISRFDHYFTSKDELMTRCPPASQ